MNISKQIFTFMLVFTVCTYLLCGEAKSFSGSKSSFSSNSTREGLDTKEPTSVSYPSADGT
ncbi:hypothetical protein [Bacillus cereus]